ncbi:hypothetical protein Tco_0448616 [Tanacetum coccineum]
MVLEVDMAEFRRNIDANIEWVGSKEIVEVVEEGFKDEEVYHKDFDSGSDSEWKVSRFSCEDGNDVSGSKRLGSDGSKSKSQSKEKGQVSGSKGKSIKKTKPGGSIKDKA